MSETGVVKENMAKVKEQIECCTTFININIVGINIQKQGNGPRTKIPGVSAT